jgi:hypothetical protein
LEKLIFKFAWLVVIAAALSISTWSLTELGRSGGLALPIACLISAAYDGGAIASSLIALRWSQQFSSSGGLARLATILFAGSSSWLNWQHGVELSNTIAIRYLLALPPIIAVVILELYLHFLHRGSLKRAGKITDGYPHIDGLAWLLFPFKTIHHLRVVVKRRLDSVTGIKSTAVIAVRPPGMQKSVRAWAREQGYPVGLRGRIPREIENLYARAMANGHELTEGE